VATKDPRQAARATNRERATTRVHGRSVDDWRKEARIGYRRRLWVQVLGGRRCRDEKSERPVVESQLLDTISTRKMGMGFDGQGKRRERKKKKKRKEAREPRVTRPGRRTGRSRHRGGSTAAGPGRGNPLRDRGDRRHPPGWSRGAVVLVIVTGGYPNRSDLRAAQERSFDPGHLRILAKRGLLPPGAFPFRRH